MRRCPGVRPMTRRGRRYAGERRAGGAQDEHRAGGAQDEHRAGGAQKEHRAGGAQNEHRAGGAQNEHRAGGAQNEHRAEGAHNEHRAGGGQMSTASELTRWTAAEMAAAVAAGEVSAVELTTAHLERIARTDVQVRAFLCTARDSALAAASAVDGKRASGQPLGSLAGVPLALKDVFTTADMPTTCGSRILAGWQPPYDATITARLRSAGVVILGKT